mgnify:CR=1 FL=1
MAPDTTPASRQCGPGRPRGFDEGQALAAALEVFWRQGYEATSVDDLIRAMDLSRSSFYCCFGSKHDAFLAAVRRYTDASYDTLADAGADAPSPAEAVRRMLRTLVRSDDGCRGCLLVNCITELAGRDPEVQALVRRHLDRVEALLADTLAEAEPEGAADLARALMSLTVGAITLRKAGLPAERIDAALDRANALLPPG